MKSACGYENSLVPNVCIIFLFCVFDSYVGPCGPMWPRWDIEPRSSPTSKPKHNLNRGGQFEWGTKREEIIVFSHVCLCESLVYIRCTETTWICHVFGRIQLGFCHVSVSLVGVLLNWKCFFILEINLHDKLNSISYFEFIFFKVSKLSWMEKWPKLMFYILMRSTML